MPPLQVVAAVIEMNGAFLLTRRLPGSHLAGMWEFPGGKCEPGETHVDALSRELREELGIEIQVGDLIWSTRHSYPERVVMLHFYRCTMNGAPSPLLGQEVRMVARSNLKTLEFPPADAELVGMLAAPKVGG